jgi:exosortase/archaeosortase family protein
MRAWLEHGDRGAAVALVAQLAAFTPAWAWYGARLLDVANEPWGLMALLAAALLPRRPRRELVHHGGAAGLTVPTALVALYAGSYAFVPALVSTLVAMACVGVTYSLWRHRAPWLSPRWGLVLLSVPMLTSVHFYLGYPLRVATGGASAVLLQLAGFNVVRDGVCLRWAGRLVMIDAPCSGVRMLWAGVFLVLALASRNGLGPGRAVRAAAAAVGVVLAGNVLRTTALFFPEAGIFAAPPWLHEAVGVAIFVAVAAAIAGQVRRAPEPAR